MTSEVRLTVTIIRSLKVLDLSHNSMERLDKVISSLRKLEMINISHNNLVEDKKHFTFHRLANLGN